MQKGTPPSKAKEGPGQKFESNQSDRSAAERSKWLEEEIARLETRIRQLDGWLETEGSICGNSTCRSSKSVGTSGESLAASRDELLAEWLELS
ncbi:Uncharacterised protein [Actinobacillus pleuropneumoniae]|nr:Uncharacterised protein [Actinobacillus pleuropneumoniae]